MINIIAMAPTMLADAANVFCTAFPINSVGALGSCSGEKIVDNLVLNTVKKALDINLKMNLSSLANIQGNPILVINL